jgi:hypothetical protein
MPDSPTAPRPWTRERVYSDPADDFWSWPPFLTHHCIYELRDSRLHHCYDYYTPEFCSAIASEQNFQREIPILPLSPETVQLVMNGETCPQCGSTKGGEVRTPHRGLDTGIQLTMPVRCSCGIVVRFRDQWNKQMRAHRRFTDVRLSAIAPYPRLALDLETQARIITAIKASRSDSYFLVGPPNTGKSHLMTALFRHALGKWATQSWVENAHRLTVWRISAAQLLDEHVAWATRSPGEGKVPPTVQISAIHAAAEDGFRPCLFLDEIDKIVPTEFKLNKLIEVIDAVYTAEGQIVATSNKGLAALIAKWGFDEAGTAIRRIGGGPGAHTINFQNGHVPV